MARLILSYKDHDGEGSTVSVRTVDFTAAEFDAQNTALNGLRDAIEGVTLGALTKESRVAVETENAYVLPANGFAQRETKWLVSFTQADGQQGSFEIPCADLSLLQANSEEMNISAGAGLTLVTAIEGNVRGRDGELVSVNKIIHVGRSI